LQEFLEVVFESPETEMAGIMSRIDQRFFRPAEVDLLIRRRLEGEASN